MNFNEKSYLNGIKIFDNSSYTEELNFNSIINDNNRINVISWIANYFNNIDSKRESKGLYLFGNFGCGKTYLITVLFNELVKKGFTSCIVYWPDLLREGINENFNSNLDYIKKVQLLLIDDIGSEYPSVWRRDDVLYPILKYRFDNGLTTFFTSNLSIKELEDHQTVNKTEQDKEKVDKVISLIKDMTDVLEVNSKNYRK